MLQKLTINLSFLVVIALMALATTPAWSGQVTYADDSYASGDTLTAADMNAKFSELKAMINDNNTRIAALESDFTAAKAIISSLQSTTGTHTSDINAINTSNMMALDPYLSVDTLSDPRGPLVQLSGINLQLMNGVDSTTVNGLGNLIIGYDPVRSSGVSTCSIGTYTDESNCTTNSGTWALSHKTGSHYLVIGDQNNYSQHSGTVIGVRNTASNLYSSVSGGRNNTASGFVSSVSGGDNNTASGSGSSVSGGSSNTASGSVSSVSGGYNNIASGNSSSVSGGVDNTASGFGSSISGGWDCDTTAIDFKWVVGLQASAGCSGNAN